MSTQEQRERFEAWATKANFDVERYGISPGYQDTHTDDAWVAWQAAQTDAIERCAKFMEARADEIAAAENCTANMMAMIYRDEAKSLRSLLPKEE